MKIDNIYDALSLVRSLAEYGSQRIALGMGTDHCPADEVVLKCRELELLLLDQMHRELAHPPVLPSKVPMGV